MFSRRYIASFANSWTCPIDDQAGVLWGRSDKEVLYRTQNLECQSNRIFIYSYLQYIISGQFMVVWRWGSSKFDLRVVEQSSICHLKQVSINNNLNKPAKNSLITFYSEICQLPSFYFLPKNKWTGNISQGLTLSLIILEQ